MMRSLGIFLMLMNSSTLHASTVTRLRCEHLVEPLGVDARLPRLNWQIDSDRRGEKQVAFQVVVTGDDGKVVWDSGEVKSDDVQVAYDGEPLTSGRRYSWKVRTWDRGEPLAF